MAIEHIGIAQVIAAAQSRACIKRRPGVFFLSFIGGIIFAALIALFAWQMAREVTPYSLPTLRLVNTEIKVGGALGFYQSSRVPSYCPQETMRVIWAWTDESQRVRAIWPLSDSAPVPPLWNGQSIVYIRLPRDIAPGAYFYVRETQSYCSMFSWFLGRPSVERTLDLPFTVVP